MYEEEDLPFGLYEGMLYRVMQNVRESRGSRVVSSSINPLKPNCPYIGRTAPLTSKRCVLYIYSTNIGTEYFKHGIYAPFFFLFKMQFVS
jgi:hypothetical protein